MSVARRLSVCVLALAVSSVGCRRPERQTTPTARAERDPEARPRKTWDGFAKLGELQIVGEVHTAHPAGDFVGAIRVNGAAGSYGQKGRGALPEGALIVEALAAEPGAPPVLYYAMERRSAGYFPDGGDWAYWVIGKEGEIQAEGKLKLCARCHAEAPRDHLFETFRHPATP